MNLTINPIFLNVITIISLIILIMLLNISSKNKLPSISESFNGIIVPGEISTLTFGNMYYVKSMVATLLDLHRRGNILISIDNTDYSISFISDENLEKSEEYLLNYLKSFGEKITSTSIAKEKRSAPDDFNKAIQKYFDLIEDSLVQKKLNRKENHSKNVFIILISLFFLILGISLISLGQILAILIILLSLILAFIELKKIFNKTIAGDKLQRQYLNLAQTATSHDYTLHENPNSEFITLVCLGLKNERLLQLYPLTSLPDYETMFDCTNYILTDKKSRP